MNLKIWKIWFAFVFMAAFLWCGQETAWATTKISNEAYAADLVNQIRYDPLGYAQRLGYNRDQLLQQQPWLAQIAQGLGAVAGSNFLTRQAASKNAEEVLAGGLEILYFEDAGETVSEPFATMNTDYAAEGDISGVVTFYNFMDPQTAISVVINNQLKNELNPAYEGKHLLLATEFRQIGTAIRAGQIQVETGFNNAFFVYICFSSTLLKSEVQVVNMLNQVRAFPGQAYHYLPVNLGFLPGGYNPLFFNDALISASRTVLYKEVDVLAHALYFGFPQPDVGYTATLEVLPKADPNLLTMWIFSSLLVKEIAVYPKRDAIFNYMWNEIGPALCTVGNDSYESIKLTMVSGFAKKTNPGFSRIYGVVYADTDTNGVYTPGEDASDKLISVYDNLTKTRVRTVVTNKAGQFSLTLPNNVEYNIETAIDGNRSGKLIVLTHDQYLNLKIEAQ